MNLVTCRRRAQGSIETAGPGATVRLHRCHVPGTESPTIDDGAPLAYDDVPPKETDRGRWLVGSYRRARTDLILRREGDEMGLTTAVVLLAALTAGNDLAPHSKLDVLIIVWTATIGLTLVNWFAQLVTARITSGSWSTSAPREALLSQMFMSTVVAVTATLFVVVLPAKYDRLGARLAAALFIGALVAIETRRSGLPRPRRVALSVGLTLVGVTVATVKWFIS